MQTGTLSIWPNAILNRLETSALKLTVRYITKGQEKTKKGSKIKITSLLQIQQLESFQRGQTERKEVSKSVSLEGIQG